MDEHTLNDLLECSVCLERLDTSSKVLPCQHTFCRRCLEVIVSSHAELRCPECRILVTTKIDDLPPNVLLMRILEGMKNAALAKNPHSHQQQQQPLQQPADLSTAFNKQKSPTAPQAQTHSASNTANAAVANSSSSAAAINHANNRWTVPHAFALFDFASTESGDLSFKKGDTIILKRRIDANWYVGMLHGVEGTFPANYVRVIVPLPTPHCIALYDFKMATNEDEGCLCFTKGTVIQVLRRIDQNWAEGCIGAKIGIFPISFVGLNPLAKQLLNVYQTNAATATATIAAEENKQHKNRRNLPPIPNSNSIVMPDSNPSFNSFSSSQATSQQSSPNSSNSSSNSLSSSGCNQSLPNTPLHCNSNNAQNTSTNSVCNAAVRLRDLKQKRHSFNALLSNLATPTTSTTAGNGLNMLQSNRHSAEILSVPNELVTEQSPQQDNAMPRANVLATGLQQQHLPTLPWTYLALYPYKPRKNDELELKKGCVYRVTERCLDGWFKGRNWQGTAGVFPGNYVTPLRKCDQQQIMHQWQFMPLQDASTQSNANPNANARPTSMLLHSPPDLPPRQIGFSQPQPTPAAAKDNSISSTTSTALNLVKRLTKRTKSPNQAQAATTNLTEIATAAPATHALHIRSGSCPSQLLQNLPIDLSVSKSSSKDNNVQPPTQSSALAAIGFGSQRVKTQKERAALSNMRKSMDASTMRNMFNQMSQNVANKCAQMQAQAQTTASQSQSHYVGCNPLAIQHRKSHSLDANSLLLPSTTTAETATAAAVPLVLNEAAVAASATTKSTNCNRESRFRCVVPYPPNSDVELELHVDDIIYVQRKQKNGWYKGTHARTNKTGLFPASFVEPDV